MRIAQIAPITVSIPPKKYGGIERIVSALTEELVQRGHDVTLFASGDSVTSANHVSFINQSVDGKNRYTQRNLSLLHIGLAYEQQRSFDIIHDHFYELSMPTAHLSTTPVVMTVHGPFTQANILLYKQLKNVQLVTISKAQIPQRETLNIIDTVYNGLSMQHYPFHEKHEGYLLFVGRISEEKGVHHAIEVAQHLNIPLILAARVDAPNLRYFNDVIKPKLIDKRIMWLGEVNEHDRNQLMSRAMAFLHPVTWPEPFGLTLIEAMATGCPVIGFNKGSIPEVIQNGVTGFVVSSAMEMAAAVEKIHTINRAACREYVLNTFTVKNMVDGYERIYQQIANSK